MTAQRPSSVNPYRFGVRLGYVPVGQTAHHTMLPMKATATQIAIGRRRPELAVPAPRTSTYSCLAKPDLMPSTTRRAP